MGTAVCRRQGVAAQLLCKKRIDNTVACVRHQPHDQNALTAPRQRQRCRQLCSALLLQLQYLQQLLVNNTSSVPLFGSMARNGPPETQNAVHRPGPLLSGPWTADGSIQVWQRWAEAHGSLSQRCFEQRRLNLLACTAATIACTALPPFVLLCNQ